MSVPLAGLLSDSFAAERRALIGPTAATKPVPPGIPTDNEGPSTTHLTVADKWGNVVSYTFTIESTGGSGIVAGDKGFLLNNELTDFNFTTGTANSPAGNKRPRSSMAPTIMLRNGRPEVAVGSPGGSMIITTVLQTLVEHLDFGRPLPDAIATPRASQRNTAAVSAEPAFIASPDAAALQALGHTFTNAGEIGAATGIDFQADRVMQAVAEPVRRGGGHAAALRGSATFRRCDCDIEASRSGRGEMTSGRSYRIRVKIDLLGHPGRAPTPSLAWSRRPDERHPERRRRGFVHDPADEAGLRHHARRRERVSLRLGGRQRLGLPRRRTGPDRPVVRLEAREFTGSVRPDCGSPAERSTTLTRPLLLISLVIVAAASAAPAGAVIHPGHSIAGVELGMTRAQVRAELGEPARVTRGSNEFGPFRVFRYFRLWVTFQGEETVTAVKTTRTRERTPRDAGVRSTRAQLLARVRAVRCRTATLCEKGRLVPGGRVTVFRLFNGRVTSVLVGFVID